MRFDGPLEDLENRSFDSYRARIQTEKRMRATGHWWNAAQFSLTSALLSVSIAFLGLGGSTPNGGLVEGGTVALAVLSVLALVVSIVCANLDYSARAKEMFRNYRELQSFSVKVELLRRSRARVSRRQLRDLSREYQNLLDKTENHQSQDHLMAKLKGSLLWSAPIGVILGATRPFLLPVLLVVTSALIVGFVTVKVFMMLNG